uniref:Dipeptidylpeptidase I n=1 Tax=Tenebrio molitor TaxID=7067 RepID=A0A286MG49_TENMO|nr:dipeptidylpeptidase I [Tenebrio molitor]
MASLTAHDAEPTNDHPPYWMSVNLDTTKKAALLNMLTKARPRSSQAFTNTEQDLCGRRAPSRLSSTYTAESYSVGDPFLRPDLMSEADYTITNQKQCGSCYALASTYALQKRLELAMSRRLKDGTFASKASRDGGLPSYRLSSNLVLSCSFLNQGCLGGYPPMVHEWWTVFGAGIEDCEGTYKDNPLPCPLATTQQSLDGGLVQDGRLPPLKFVKNPAEPATTKNTALRGEHSAYFQSQLPASVCPESHRVFVEQHGYVGGCYGCATEEAMRREIVEHGPIVAAIDAPASLITYHNGIFDDPPTNHHRACSSSERDEGLHGWEFTNHAIVLVGFGVENIVHGERSIEVPYWIARNTWGADWGQHGYFKIRRKVNLGGIENQSSFADVDITRGLPRRIMEERAT